MKLYDQRISKNISVSSAAFYANFIYLVIAMVFALIQQFANPTGEAYDTFLGIVEFVVVTMYWVIINVIFFSRPGRTKSGTILTYFVFTLLPICVFTLASAIIITYYPTADFQYSWNILTWIVAPTLFWYLPFSYAYYSLGYYLNIVMFMGVGLVYVLFLMLIGMLFGLAWSSRHQEKEAAINRQRERNRQRKRRASVTIEEANAEEKPIITEPILDKKLYTGTNPFVGQDTDSNIIYTENFDVITDQDLKDAAHKYDNPDEVIQTGTILPRKDATRQEKRALKKQQRELKKKQKKEQKEKKKQQKKQS